MATTVSTILKQIRFAPFRNHSKSFGTFLDVSVKHDTGFVTVTMKKPPVNSLNLEILTEFDRTLTELEKERIRGMILTSSLSTVFSAGLDILEMHNPKPHRFKEFYFTLQSVWMKLYGSTFPTAAAINGHSPAGGCMLALACEYRAMLPGYRIGLNETQLGIVATYLFRASMMNTISTRQTELALTSGRLFTTDEALKIGLVDEIAEDRNELLVKCEQFLKTFDKIPSHARYQSKMAIRGKDIEFLRNGGKEEVEVVYKEFIDPEVQRSIENYLQALKNKS